MTNIIMFDGLEPATGETLQGLERLQELCFEFIKTLELEKSGVRDGNGYWNGADVLGHYAREIENTLEEMREKQRAFHSEGAP